MPSDTLVPSPMNFNGDPMYVEIETALMSGTAPYTPDEPNLSCYLEIWQDVAGTESKVLTTNLPYSRWNKKAQLDLSNILDLKARVPSRSHITLLSTTIGSGPADGAAAKVFFKFGDMFGNPAVPPGTVVVSDKYVVVAGASMYWYGFGTGAAYNTMLNAMYDINGKVIVKEVRKKQPEYLYFYSNSLSGSVSVKVNFNYTDGDNNEVTISAPGIVSGKVNYVAVGWNQLHLDNHVNGAKTLSFYSITITGIDDSWNYYRLHDHDQETDQYFLFDNGIGGCEVVRVSGYHEINFSGKKEVFVKARARGLDFQTGLSGTYNPQGSEEWKVNTGYITQEYARHLQQMCLGDCWYIDISRKSFIKCRVVNDSVKLFNYADDNNSIEFTVKFEERSSASTYKA